MFMPLIVQFLHGFKKVFSNDSKAEKENSPDDTSPEEENLDQMSQNPSISFVKIMKSQNSSQSATYETEKIDYQILTKNLNDYLINFLEKQYFDHARYFLLEIYRNRTILPSNSQNYAANVQKNDKKPRILAKEMVDLKLALSILSRDIQTLVFEMNNLLSSISGNSKNSEKNNEFCLFLVEKVNKLISEVVLNVLLTQVKKLRSEFVSDLEKVFTISNKNLESFQQEKISALETLQAHLDYAEEQEKKVFGAASAPTFSTTAAPRNMVGIGPGTKKLISEDFDPDDSVASGANSGIGDVATMAMAEDAEEILRTEKSKQEKKLRYTAQLIRLFFEKKLKLLVIQFSWFVKSGGEVPGSSAISDLIFENSENSVEETAKNLSIKEMQSIQKQEIFGVLIKKQTMALISSFIRFINVPIFLFFFKIIQFFFDFS